MLVTTMPAGVRVQSSNGFEANNGWAGRAAGLLEARCRVHRVADQGYLSLESANLSGHERA